MLYIYIHTMLYIYIYIYIFIGKVNFQLHEILANPRYLLSANPFCTLQVILEVSPGQVITEKFTW